VYENTFDDYNEMAIQFGYVTMFAVAFPFASVCALINNIIEMRTDAIKILKGFQRPLPREAINIGNWLQILEILSYIAIITNSSIIVFTSHKLEMFLRSNYSTDELEIVKLKWGIAILIEHVCFLLKFILSLLIPDTPHWVRQAHARQVYERKVHLGGEEEEEDCSTDEEGTLSIVSPASETKALIREIPSL